MEGFAAIRHAVAEAQEPALASTPAFKAMLADDHASNDSALIAAFPGSSPMKATSPVSPSSHVPASATYEQRTVRLAAPPPVAASAAPMQHQPQQPAAAPPSVLALSPTMPRAMQRPVWRTADFRVMQKLYTGYASKGRHWAGTLSRVQRGGLWRARARPTATATPRTRLHPGARDDSRGWGPTWLPVHWVEDVASPLVGRCAVGPQPAAHCQHHS